MRSVNLSASEIAYLEELPPESICGSIERYGRHRCPVPGCDNTVRYGNVVCGPCWTYVPWSKRREVAAAFQLRETRPDLWAAACEVALLLAIDYMRPNCRRAVASSENRAPESDPAPSQEAQIA